MRLLRFPRVGFLATLLFFFCVCGKAYALHSVVVELGSIEGDEEATTPPIQEPTQTVEERPFSDAENEKEKRDWMNKNLLARAKENKETIKNTIWNNDCGCGI